MKLPECKTPRIVIVGGGVAGLLLATRLGQRVSGRRGRVTLVDRNWTHVWKPMLHTFAAGTWNIHQQQVQYLLHARTHRFEYVPGQVDSIDRVASRVLLAPMQGAPGEAIADPRELEYDVLILAFGSRANDFGTPGVAEHCQFIDSQDQADAFNAHLRAHVARSVFQNRTIDIGIVGGGATGVELAAELSRMVELAAGYGEIDIRRRLRVTLLESASRILSALPETVSISAAAQLRALGVDVRTGVRVVAADAGGFLLEGGELVPAALKVWAAGVRASTSLDKNGLELNRAGQVVVQPNLLAKGERSIFALGDCASFVPVGWDRPLPPTAQVANQQALHLIRHLPAWLLERKLVPPFRFRDLGALVSLSDYNAFGTLGRFGFFTGRFIKGHFARLSHALLYRRHQLALHGVGRAALLWLAERINALVQPKIRMT